MFIGNGVSEMITMVLQAFTDNGNEILVPAPDYPLWTAAVSLAGGTPVHYRCDEADRLEPRPRRHRATDHAEHLRAGRDQPNNPTGAVYSREHRQGDWSTSPGGTTWW